MTTIDVTATEPLILCGPIAWCSPLRIAKVT